MLCPSMQIVQVNTATAKQNFSNLVNQVFYGGKQVVVTSRGKPKAKIVAFDEVKRIGQKPAQETSELIADIRTLVLHCMVHRRILTLEEGAKALEHFRRIRIALTEGISLMDTAWELSRSFHQPRVYDTAYLALAQQEGCPFWTADKRFSMQ